MPGRFPSLGSLVVDPGVTAKSFGGSEPVVGMPGSWAGVGDGWTVRGGDWGRTFLTGVAMAASTTAGGFFCSTSCVHVGSQV